MKKRLFGSAFFVCSLSLAVVLALCAPAGATLFTSKAAYTGDWSEGTTWTNGTAPSDGDDAQITNAGSVVILSSASSNLNSLILGKTLTFTNWNTSLTATNVTILTNGVMTLPGPFNEDPGVSNNIYIVCSNLTIGGGGTINANAMGYIGNTNSAPGYGPGKGSGTMGGGYGGQGGNATTNFGLTYGNFNAPTAPGSSGGGTFISGSGGGAIRIQASGTVTINGTITANGGPVVFINTGGGSGGGIYIICNTFTGTNGIIRANGGVGVSGMPAGGGGRIAVIYNTNAQASIIPVPSIMFQAAPGGSSSFTSGGDAGTLYFPDNFFLTETFRHAGYWSLPGFTNWAPNNLLISNGWLGFPADGFQLTVTNNLSIVGTNANLHRLVLTNGMVTCGGNMFLTNSALVLYAGMTSGPTLDCGGNLILSNNSAMYVFSGPTNGGSETAWGTLINVANNVQIKTNAVLYLSSHPTNGGSALLRMRNLTIAQGGTINVDERGYVGKVSGFGPGRGSGAMGGGYGGRGGGATTNFGLTYGNSNAPTEPGSTGGGASFKPGSGGGLARIQASDTITLNGTVTANGGPVAFINTGAGSGGGIYITCRSLAGTGGVLRANGGNGVSTWPGGGGGRIAVWRIYDYSSSITSSVTAGTIGTPAAENGTVVWGMIPNPGTLFVIQ